jgi:hypothetical protein
MEIINTIAFLVRCNQGQQAILALMLLNRHWHSCIVGAPGLFEHVVVSSNMTLDALAYLLSLSKGSPLRLVYSIQSTHPRSKSQRVTDIIAQHSHRIRYLTLQCLDWRGVDIRPLAEVSWPIVRQVYVVGFGLLDRTHHMIFYAWEIHIFLDWARGYGLTPPSRVIVYGGLPCKPKHQLLHSVPQSIKDIVPSDIDCFHNSDHDPTSLEILQVSCLEFTPLMALTISMLSSYSFPSLKILSIHIRFYGRSTGVTRTPWTQLATKCLSVQKLTLPYGDDGIVLLSDDSIWRAVTCLTFTRGPTTLTALAEMVICRRSAGIPLQRIELYDWASTWSLDEVASLRKLVDVAFVNDIIEVM